MAICNISNAQQKQLSAKLIDDSKVTDLGLYFDGKLGINYQFSPRITPHGDAIDVVNGYVFVTWYKGGMDKRNLMLSRRKLDSPSANWVTIEFPHQHIGFRGDPTIGDSHNTAAIGVSTIDNTIHLLYDMHAYNKRDYPNDYFNYSVSVPNAAFVPDEEFNLSLFNPKRNYLKQGQNYTLVTYPMLHRADDGSLLVRFRYGGSGFGDIIMAHYNGSEWTNNWLYSKGRNPEPNRYNLYGSEKFLNGKFYSGFSVRYRTNADYRLNSGLYFAYTNGIPKNQNGQWFDANNKSISIPQINPDDVKVAEPGADYGTSSKPRTAFDPSFTVTESGAIHFITKVDNVNVHYYKPAGAISFSSAGAGLIPFPDVRGDIFSYKNHVFMVELLDGKPVIKSTLEGTNNWKIAYESSDSKEFLHFDAFIEEDKLYVYLMEDTSSDARPLYVQSFDLSEKLDTSTIRNDIALEAEHFTSASPDVEVGGSPTASNGQIVSVFRGNRFLEYKFKVASAGFHDFSLFAANRNKDESFMDIEINGVAYNNVSITRTFDWDVFAENVIPNILLKPGENVVKITQRSSLSSRPDKLEFKLNPGFKKEKPGQTEVIVYPNPSRGVFNIETSLVAPNYKLVSMQGRVLETGVVGEKELNLSNYPKGLYFLELTSGSIRILKKIIIN